MITCGRAELLLSRETRRTLAQLRTNKSPLLVSYLFSIGDPRHPSPLCPLCLMHDHTSSHLFECKSLPTSLSSLDLWTNPDKVEPFLATYGERLLAATWFGCWTLLAARWWSGVDNNNNNDKIHWRTQDCSIALVVIAIFIFMLYWIKCHNYALNLFSTTN